MFFTIFQKEKTSFYAIKTRSLKRRKIRIFANRLVHGFGQKLSRFPSFYLRQNRPRKCVAQYSRRKKRLLQTIKARSLTSGKLVFFPKWLSQWFWSKIVNFSTVLLQAKQARKMCFTIFQKGKMPVWAIKTRSLKGRKMGVFPKGLVHGFGLKVSIFPSFCFRQKRPGKQVSRYSRKKKRLSTLKTQEV